MLYNIIKSFILLILTLIPHIFSHNIIYFFQLIQRYFKEFNSLLHHCEEEKSNEQL